MTISNFAQALATFLLKFGNVNYMSFESSGTNVNSVFSNILERKQSLSNTLGHSF